MARLAIAKGFLGEYAKLDKDVQTAGAEEIEVLNVDRLGLSVGIEPHAIGVAARSAGLVREAREALEADAESFLAWETAPGRRLRLADLDVSARRFLTEGADQALDLTDRCLDLLDRLTGRDPDLAGVRLPRHFIDAAGTSRRGCPCPRTSCGSCARPIARSSRPASSARSRKARCRSGGKAGTWSLLPWRRSARWPWGAARRMPCTGIRAPASCSASRFRA